MKAGVFLSPLGCDSLEIEAGVNRMLIVCVMRFSYLTDVWLQEVFYSLFRSFLVTPTLMEVVLTASLSRAVL